MRPMSVVLRPLVEIKPHEFVNADHSASIARSIRTDQAIWRPLIIARRCRTLLDGHHRYTALNALGADLAPCVEVDYDDPAEVEVTAWRPDELVTPEMVRSAAARGEMMPPKTSRHLLKFSIPSIRVPLSDLLRGASTRPGSTGRLCV
ncbi:ParB-like nuclease domain protein [Phaeobacter piscinae]|uniref:ParB-like nuclease domain protein n=1 Tax=Phaeobacter piscinae TaxID=1580596 RepID=A0ABM6P9L4_9RHOB|nr:ParB-like nuclease domain protein [Phaeobacter piscinae]AUQ84838.1 ParB-like nuclease domain protein [Phaeobacter piscinae]AUR22721.1 ParB-like nuclease domain protein [Phaeobacter piscinae]